MMEITADLGSMLMGIAEQNKALVAQHPYQTFLRQGVDPEQLDCLLANPVLLDFQPAHYEGVQVSTLWWGFDICLAQSFLQQLARHQKKASEVASIIAATQPELAPIAGIIGASVLSACQRLSAADMATGVHFPITWHMVANPYELASHLLPKAKAKTG